MSTEVQSSAERGLNPPRTLAQDKWYYGAYLNMARHNAYMLVKDAGIRLGFGEGPEKLEESQVFSLPLFNRLRQGPPDVQRRVIRELRSAFHWLEPAMLAWIKPDDAKTTAAIQKLEAAPEDYCAFFKVFFDTLNKMRNEYSHAVLQPFDMDTHLLHCLRKTYDAAWRKAKERFSFSDEEVKHLERIKVKNDPQDRRKKIAAEPDNFPYAFVKKATGKITEHGVAFMTCLLLEQKYANLFTQQIERLKAAGTKSFRASRETFAVFAIRLPNARHTSASPQGALLLDMLNELARCPAPLYPQLKQAYKDKFKVVPDKDNGEEAVDEAGLPVLLRHDDRFPYFAQRFIDEAKWFDKLRFPIDLGNYHYHLYDKEVDGEARTGSLWKKVIGWDRLNSYEAGYYEDGKPEAWKALSMTPAQKEEGVSEETRKTPYITLTAPHYHMSDDGTNIAMRIVQREKDESIWPEVRAIDYEAEKRKAQKDRLKAIDDKQPASLLLSRYELVPMLWYGLLAGKEALEAALINHHNHRRRLYGDIRSGKLQAAAHPADMAKPDATTKPGAPKSTEAYRGRKAAVDALLTTYDCCADDLPDEIKSYLMGVQTRPFAVRAAERIDKLIEETERRRKSIEKQLLEKRRPGSKKDVQIKAGRLADFLAEDMLMLQPPDMSEGAKAHGKATSMAFNVLQAKLALYGANVNTLAATFGEAGLIGGKNPHPFLQLVAAAGKRNIVDFYCRYLDVRLGYFKGQKATGEYAGKHWIKNNQAARKEQEGFIAGLAAQMNQLPVVIPRGFFTERIRKELEKLGHEGLQEQLRAAKNLPNVGLMLKTYISQYKDDESQDFYNWHRVYKIINDYKEQGKTAAKGKALPDHPLSEQERAAIFKEVLAYAKRQTAAEAKAGRGKQNGPPANYEHRFKDFERTEKDIRQTKAQDMMSMLLCTYMMDKMYPGKISGSGKLRLKDIAPNADKGILNRTTNMERRFEWERDGRQENTVIVQEEIKVKNIGDFNRFAKDRRITRLLAYIGKEVATRNEIEKELEAYDECRTEIFKISQAFEETVLPDLPESIDGKSFKEIIGALKAAGKMADADGEAAKAIRNAFSHNQYPDLKVFPLVTPALIKEKGQAYFADFFLQRLKEALSYSTKNQ